MSNVLLFVCNDFNVAFIWVMNLLSASVKSKQLCNSHSTPVHVLQTVTRQNLDGQNLDGQNLDRQNLDGQNLDRQNLDGQNLDRQNLDAYYLH
jgi:uncharacterized protein YjbI with pentapeptide repeats